MKKRILMVDDFPGILELLSTYLNSKCNVEVENCVSALAGLERLNSKHFDMIISDYDMREMNGIEFLKSIRDMGHSTPFIMLTGKYDPAIEIEAQEHGAAYLQKGEYPVKQFDELLMIMRKNLKDGDTADILIRP